MNWTCPVVHAHRCAAYVELTHRFVGAGDRRAATELAGQALGQLGCAREPINAALAGPKRTQ